MPCMPPPLSDPDADGEELESFFITGTRSIPQIGHLPGASACTDGCIVQV